MRVGGDLPLARLCAAAAQMMIGKLGARALMMAWRPCSRDALADQHAGKTAAHVVISSSPTRIASGVADIDDGARIVADHFEAALPTCRRKAGPRRLIAQFDQIARKGERECGIADFAGRP